LLLYGSRIIGEGYHRAFGQPHAEVNCIAAVKEEDRKLISSSTLYVSLEPCAHFGKTPPCTDLILETKIPKVVIGCRDPFKEVAGKGVEKLQNAGVDVSVGVLGKDCKELNKRFLTFHTVHRPYIILKWAQTANSRMAGVTGERLLISNDFTNRLVHKWRSEEMGILVGTNTVLADNPELTNRLWSGKSPVRLIVDMHLRLPASAKVLDGSHPTIVFNTMRHDESGALQYYQVTEDVDIVSQVINACYQKNLFSILVEGGARLLQSFIDARMWDEARVITNQQMYIENGLPSPFLTGFTLVNSENIAGDRIDYFENKSRPSL
jgi:diaminohydroxyphosphoribosylaminopyrimidine deaminase/5-amino-6-(5-phosphoribosylamino)uracil reductase